MKKFFIVFWVIILSILFSICALASDGGSLTLPKGNEEVKVVSKSPVSELYFSYLGVKTKGNFSSEDYTYQGITGLNPGETWPDNSASSKDNLKIYDKSVVLVVILPIILSFTAVGLLIALIQKKT